jgi:hypothetical protein
LGVVAGLGWAGQSLGVKIRVRDCVRIKLRKASDVLF